MLYLKKVFPREMKGYLVILYFAEIYRTLRFKTTKENTIIYQKKKVGHLPSKINGRYFSNPTKNMVRERERKKEGEETKGNERTREKDAEKNTVLRAACLITPGDFMIPGTICKDVSA